MSLYPAQIKHCFAILFLASLIGCSKSVPSDQIAAIQLLRSVDAGASAPEQRLTTESCVDWCNPDDPDFRCFIVGGLSDGRDNQLAALYARLIQPLPIEITERELLDMFEIVDPDAEGLRGSTVVLDGKLQNSGVATVFGTTTTGDLGISFESPPTVDYDYTVGADGALVLLERAEDSSFDVYIDDSILDSTYGGRVREIRASENRVLLATDRGCLAYDPSPALTKGRMAELLSKIAIDRLAAERAAGSSTGRVSEVGASYLKLAALSDFECDIYGQDCQDCPDGEIPCKIGHKNVCMTPEECRESEGKECK